MMGDGRLQTVDMNAASNDADDKNAAKAKEAEGLLPHNDSKLEVIVCSGDQPKHKEFELEAEQHAPKDRLHLTYMIFLMHGIAVLMPWNMFITANDYFTKYKLASPSSGNSTEVPEHNIYQNYFLGFLCFVAQVPNVLLNGINLFCQVGSGSTSRRITWSIIVIVVMFIFTVVLAMMDTSEWPAAFFWITMVCVVIINSANGIYQNSVYGLAACLPMKYTNAVVLGSNTSGALTAIIALISLATAPDLRISAIYYFLTAVIVLLIAFDSFFALPSIPFYKHYSQKAEIQKKKNSEENGQGSYLQIYWNVFKKCWKEDFCVFFVFFVTLTCFPALQAGIERSDCDFFINAKYYTCVTCFLYFNLFAMIGSLLTTCVQAPGPRWIWLPIMLRVLFIPFFMFCNFQPSQRRLPVWFANDHIYSAGGILMALSGGYFSSLSMMFAPRNAEDKYKGVAGMMAAFSLILGIFFGIIFSNAVVAIVNNVGSFHGESLNCNAVAASGSDAVSGNSTLFGLSYTTAYTTFR